jgi:hypothetical protein
MEEITESSASAREVVASLWSSAAALTCRRTERARVEAGKAADALAGGLLGGETALRFRELRGWGVGVAESEGGSEDSRRCGVPGRGSAAGGRRPPSDGAGR